MIWKAVIGYENLYEVSDNGDVRSFHRQGRLLKSSTLRGYKKVILCKDGITKSFFVHRLVAASFLPNPEQKAEVNHINGDKDDNRLVNLEWCTQRENTDHKVVNNLVARNSGANSGKSKKIIDTATGKVYETMTTAAKENNLTRQLLYKYLNINKINPTTLRYAS